MAKFNLHLNVELDTDNVKDLEISGYLSTLFSGINGNPTETKPAKEKPIKEKPQKEKPIAEETPKADPKPEPDPIEEDTFSDPGDTLPEAPKISVTDIREVCKTKSEEGLRADVNLTIKKFAANLDKVDPKDYAELLSELKALKK